jgi:5'-AMP-activated protein kinase regulatory beta subunit
VLCCRQQLQRSGRDFTLIKVLQPGVYQYKFWVDGQWRYDPTLPAVSDETNNVNNVLDVQVSLLLP